MLTKILLLVFKNFDIKKNFFFRKSQIKYYKKNNNFYLKFEYNIITKNHLNRIIIFK